MHESCFCSDNYVYERARFGAAQRAIPRTPHDHDDALRVLSDYDLHEGHDRTRDCVKIWCASSRLASNQARTSISAK